jgi:hypothetical protein
VAYVSLGCQFAIGVVFVVSAFTKLTDHASFLRSLRRMRVVPKAIAPVVAVIVVAVEAAIPVLLSVPVNLVVRIGFVVATGMLAAFTGAIVWSLRHGRREPCQCFGKSTVPLGPRHVARNAVLICLSALGACAAILQPGRPELGPAAVAAVAGVFLGTVAIVADDIVDLFWPSRLSRHQPS